MQNGCFVLMANEVTSIVLDDLNPVLAKSLVGTGMKELSILVTLDGSFDFATLFPKQKFGLRGTT
jgi:hypothetical protein